MAVGISSLLPRPLPPILDVHYLHRDPELAESAIRKLEKRTNSSNWSTLLYED
jgi:hypothetical protein